jgi:hypothetical protein
VFTWQPMGDVSHNLVVILSTNAAAAVSLKTPANKAHTCQKYSRQQLISSNLLSLYFGTWSFIIPFLFLSLTPLLLFF